MFPSFHNSPADALFDSGVLTSASEVLFVPGMMRLPLECMVLRVATWSALYHLHSDERPTGGWNAIHFMWKKNKKLYVQNTCINHVTQAGMLPFMYIGFGFVPSFQLEFVVSGFPGRSFWAVFLSEENVLL